MAWRRPGDKPLSEPMIVSLLTHICVTRPQWIKRLNIFQKTIDIVGFLHVGYRRQSGSRIGVVFGNVLFASARVPGSQLSDQWVWHSCTKISPICHAYAIWQGVHCIDTVPLQDGECSAKIGHKIVSVSKHCQSLYAIRICVVLGKVLLASEVVPASRFSYQWPWR